ncbi:YgaP family membrane protein [Persephonella sp.]
MLGFWDAVIRVVVGAILVWLGIEKGGVFEITKVVGVVLILTAVFSFCPLYKLAGVSTRCEECRPA